MKLKIQRVILMTWCLSALCTWGDDTTVTVTSSWIDGEKVSTNPIYVTAVDDTAPFQRGSYGISVGTSREFKADIPEGHEVTKWSYGPKVNGSAPEKGFANEAQPTTPTTYRYTRTAKGEIGLGVHLDWLKYEISFAAGGGTGTMAKQSNVIYTNKVALANAFTRTGYDFVGWSSEPKVTTKLTDGVVVTGKTFGLDCTNKTVKLTAEWRAKTVKVTLDPESGTLEKTEIDLTYDSPIEDLPVPEKRGYTFTGWYTPEPNGRQVKAGEISKFDGPMTLTARYAVKNWTLTLGKNPGNGVGSVTLSPMASYNSYTNGTTVMMTAVAGTGSEFVSWNDGVVTSSREVVMVSNCTYCATFNKLRHLVQFHYYDENENVQTYMEYVNHGDKAEGPSRDLVDRRVRHHFTGWGDNALQAVTDDWEVTAKYEANTYVIHFAPGEGGSGYMSDQTCDVTQSPLVLTPNRYSRKGHDFAGWTRDGVTEKYADAATIEHLTTRHGESFTLTATWQPKTYTITFNPNAQGATVTPGTKTVTYGGTYGELPTPTSGGYEFRGWYTSSYGGTEITETSPVTIEEDQVLYAHWAAGKYPVTTSGENCTVTAPAEGTFDASLTFSWTPDTAEGYHFELSAVRVHSGSDAGGPVLATYSYGTTASFTFHPSDGERLHIHGTYAKIANTYTLSFATSGGSYCAPQTVTYGQTYAGKLPTPTREGYRFAGWKLEDGTELTESTVVTITDNAVATAVWEQERYTITFDGCGASGEMAAQTVGTTETPALRKNEFARTGYTFGGWATTAADAAAKKVAYRDEYVLPKNFAADGATVPLFAVWSNNTYRVRLYPNGGSGAAFREYERVFDASEKLPDGNTLFPRENYTFVGWTRDPRVGTIVTETNLTDEPDGLVLLMAVWKREGKVESPLSVAADCDTDVEDDHMALELTTTAGSDVCTIVTNRAEACSGGNDKFIRLKPTTDDYVALRFVISGAGALSFCYKTSLLITPSFDPTLDAFSSLTLKVWGTSKTLWRYGESSDGWTLENEVRIKQEDYGSADSIELAFVLNAPFNSVPEINDYALVDCIKWKPDVWGVNGTVGVTFCANDGTLAPADIVSNATHTVGTTIGRLPTLTRGEKTTNVWALDAAGEQIVDENWIVTAGDHQLYAIWEGGTDDHPIPTEADRPVIGADFSFMTDARFDYVIWTTTDLRTPADQWKMRGDVIRGDGKSVTVPVAEDSDGTVGGDPQRFYKVEVRQRK